MKLLLKLLFLAIFTYMVTMTLTIQGYKSITLAGGEFDWVRSPWAIATLFDAYFGFIAFWVWVCFKERSVAGRALWFVLIMTLGNIAISGYMLIQLFRLKKDEPVANIWRTT